jgi:LCP family protein required for cell wall assembly
MSPNDDEGRPPKRPDYKVYRARKGFSLGKPDLSSLRGKVVKKKGPDDPKAGGKQPGGPKISDRPERDGRPWLKYIGFAILGWIVLSFISFGISAQIQKGKLADTGGVLGGNPLLAAFPQNILVLGTDVRSGEFASDSEASSQKCVDAAAHGEVAPTECLPARADSIMVLRAGGGAFEKLSIPRDTYADIPGQDSQKINAAYAFGGAKLQIQTVEKFLGININHVAIVDFGGLRDFINAIGGVDVDLPQPVCNSISGGTFNIKFKHAGEQHLNGDQALTLARTRETTCGDPIDDTDRAKFQQLILSGIKGRLTSPTRIPINFLKGPIIGWNAPKALVSDMGALTMPQLILAAAIGGDSGTDVLEPAGAGPGGSLLVSKAACIKAVKKLTGDKPEHAPACSPGG